jgi:hypothetical protein
MSCALVHATTACTTQHALKRAVCAYLARCSTPRTATAAEPPSRLWCVSLQEQRAAGELQAAGVAPSQHDSMDEEDDVGPGSSPGGDSEEEEGALLMEEALEALAQAQELAARAGSLVGQYALLCDYSEQEQAELRDRLAVGGCAVLCCGCGCGELCFAAADGCAFGWLHAVALSWRCSHA